MEIPKLLILLAAGIGAWSIFSLIKNLAKETLESWGVADPNTQLLLIAVVSIGIAAYGGKKLGDIF